MVNIAFLLDEKICWGGYKKLLFKIRVFIIFSKYDYIGINYDISEKLVLELSQVFFWFLNISCYK